MAEQLRLDELFGDGRAVRFLFASSGGAVCANLLLVAPPFIAGALGSSSAALNAATLAS